MGAALHAWEITKPYSSKDTKLANAIQLTLLSILALHQQICTQFIFKKILPHVVKKHALSIAVHPSNGLDVNLKLFDLLGRLALNGIWAFSGIKNETDENTKHSLREIFHVISSAIKQLILNNPALLLPIKDDQAVDISIAVFLLMLDENNNQDIRNWLSEIIDRAIFSHQTNGQYPCNLWTYGDLLEHPEAKDDDYKKKVTVGSILYPMIAFWAALLKDDDLYGRVQYIKKQFLEHCNFQLWYPDETSEELFYINGDTHGAVLSRVRIEYTMAELLKQIFDECEHSPYFDNLSAVTSGLLPLTLVACRHYRLPIPPHLWKGFRKN